MRIGINALYLLPGKVGGSETYIRNLVTNLDRLGGDHNYFIFINKESVGVFPATSPRVKIIRCPIQATSRPVRILWEQLALPLQIRRCKIDVLLSAGMTAPFYCPARSVLVIYDLQHVKQPGNFRRWYLLFLRLIMYASAKTADRILAISEHTKEDIIKYYKIRPEKIAVSYLAVNHDVFTPEVGKGDAPVLAKYGLPEHYILYSAALLPHKNHERLLRAFREVRDKLPERKIVLTGAWESGYDAIIDIISALDLRKDVMMLGWLPFADIPAIYRGAELFVYPTLHEGFGLPILEAMASGVPVVCSRIEPLIEVAGNAALLVDPYDQSDIARALLALYRDKTLRMKLIEGGILRAKIFSWEKTAIDTLNFLSKKMP